MQKRTYFLTQKQNLWLFLSGWLGLTLLSFFFSFVFVSLGPLFIDPTEMELFLQSGTFLSSLNLLTYISLFVFAILITWVALPPLISEFGKLNRWGKGLGYGFVVLFIGIMLGILYDALHITLDDNLNQSTINSLVVERPFLSFITFVFLGPIVEEFTYRLGLFTYLARRSRLLAYVLTLSLFGLIHFNFTNTDLINELLNLPFYLSAGLFFCYVYEKEGFAVVTLAHITNNLISILSILMINQLGGTSS